MENQTNTNLVICSGLALALALAIWSPVQVLSAEPVDENIMNHTNSGMSGWTSGLIWTMVGVLAVVLLRVVTIKMLKK